MYSIPLTSTPSANDCFLNLPSPVKSIPSFFFAWYHTEQSSTLNPFVEDKISKILTKSSSDDSINVNDWFSINC